MKLCLLKNCIVHLVHLLFIVVHLYLKSIEINQFNQTHLHVDCGNSR